jgi:MFS transporter, YQGE family, putative transporter
MKLSSDMRKLLMMNNSFQIIFSYISIFVNLYIWEKSNRISDIAIYNLVMYAVLVIFFTWGGKLLLSYSIRFLMGLSSIFAAASFIILLFYHPENHFLWLAFLGTSIGILQGFFWSGMNLTLVFFGRGHEFTEYFSVQAIISQVINIALPILSGFIIKYFGYNSSFALMFIFVIMMFLTSFQIPKFSLKEALKENERLLDRKELVTLLVKPGFRWNFPANVLSTFFVQFQSLFALLFTFSITDNQLYIALLNVCYTLCCIVALQVYKRVRSLKENVWLFVGMIFVSFGFLLALYPIAPILVLSNVLTTVGMFYFGTIFSSQQYRIMEYEDILGKLRVLILQDWVLAVARLFIFSLIYFVKDFKGPFFVGLLILALTSCLLLPLFQKKAMHEIHVFNQKE